MNIPITSKQIMKICHKNHAYKSLEHNSYVKGNLSLSLLKVIGVVTGIGRALNNVISGQCVFIFFKLSNWTFLLCFLFFSYIPNNHQPYTASHFPPKVFFFDIIIKECICCMLLQLLLFIIIVISSIIIIVVAVFIINLLLLLFCILILRGMLKLANIIINLIILSRLF